jgi:hypothetical protein
MIAPLVYSQGPIDHRDIALPEIRAPSSISGHSGDFVWNDKP